MDGKDDLSNKHKKDTAVMEVTEDEKKGPSQEKKAQESTASTEHEQEQDEEQEKEQEGSKTEETRVVIPVVEEPDTESKSINGEHSVTDEDAIDDEDDDDVFEDEDDELSEANQLAIQESDQHDYEYSQTAYPPEDLYPGMYNEQGYPMSALGPNAALLIPQSKALEGRKLLVLDLDETLIHSSFKFVHNADFIIPVRIEDRDHEIYVIKRPGVDEFMKRMGELFEIVVFTASVSKYADPLLDQLDIHHVVHHRLFRESCYNHNGNFVKHLGILGRPLEDVIILDNTPTSYIFHPQHAVPVSSWFSDAHDNELLDMVPILEDLSSKDVYDVSLILDVNLTT